MIAEDLALLAITPSHGFRSGRGPPHITTPRPLRENAPPSHHWIIPISGSSETLFYYQWIMDHDKVDGPPAKRKRPHLNGWRNTTKRATKRRLATEKTPVISARTGGMGGFPSPAPIPPRFASGTSSLCDWPRHWILTRHARPCSGHPRLELPQTKSWMAGTSPAMTACGSVFCFA
jgi:hypothetical protein